MGFIIILFKVIQLFFDVFRYTILSIVRPDKTEQYKKQWSVEFFKKLGATIEIRGIPSQEKSVIFVGNHISYLDIPLLLLTVPHFYFVAKKQIKYWPIVSQAANRIGTLFVDREDKENRKKIKHQISKYLKSGYRIVLFPSGTTQINEKKRWNKGAFEIAKHSGFNVQPFRISYSPLRECAYVDNDNFILHLFQLFALKQFKIQIEFSHLTNIVDPLIDSIKWQGWASSYRFEQQKESIVECLI